MATAASGLEFWERCSAYFWRDSLERATVRVEGAWAGPRGQTTTHKQSAQDHVFNATPMSDLERERRRFQQKLDSIDQEDDPLDVYYSYARWLEENYKPQEANDSGLIDLLEQATQQLNEDPTAKGDLRYLKLWIMYAKYVEDSTSIFNHIYTNNVGTKYALFYEEYGELLERTG